MPQYKKTESIEEDSVLQKTWGNVPSYTDDHWMSTK